MLALRRVEPSARKKRQFLLVSSHPRISLMMDLAILKGLNMVGMMHRMLAEHKATGSLSKMSKCCLTML